jgi:hypothetical protein
MTWANIPGWPGYQISSSAEVISFRQSAKGKVLKQRPDGATGYLQVTLRRDGKTYTRRVHTLMALTFIGPRPPGMEVCHYDGDKLNSNLWNLDYDTHQRNASERAGSLSIG